MTGSVKLVVSVTTSLTEYMDESLDPDVNKPVSVYDFTIDSDIEHASGLYDDWIGGASIQVVAPAMSHERIMHSMKLGIVQAYRAGLADGRSLAVSAIKKL